MTGRRDASVYNVTGPSVAPTLEGVIEVCACVGLASGIPPSARELGRLARWRERSTAGRGHGGA